MSICRASDQLHHPFNVHPVETLVEAKRSCAEDPEDPGIPGREKDPRSLKVLIINGRAGTLLREGWSYSRGRELLRYR